MRRRALSWAWPVTLALVVPVAGVLANCSDDGRAADDSIHLPARDGEARGDVDLAVNDGGDGLACDPSVPFGAPTRVVLDQVPYASTPRLSSDELVIYFTWRRDLDGGGYEARIGRASRTSRDASFGDAQTLEVQGPGRDPSVTTDHLSLWFQSGRDGQNDLYFATRPNTSTEFGAPALVPNLNTPENEAHPYYRLAGDELWFVAQRDGGSFDVYLAKRQSVSFGEPKLIVELSSPDEDWHPSPREDGRVILFASNREGGAGGFDLWTAERASTDAPFGAPHPVTELNSPGADHAGWLSPDGCRVYFSSDRESPDVHAVWMAERPRR